MSKGFILYANNTDNVDYVKMACALAMSIKLTQKPELSNVSLITDNVVPDKYLKLFDKVIPVPWKTDSTSRYSVDDRWKIYHVTPYEENISLDVDMLVLKDLSLLWKFFENYDIYYTSKVLDYRGNTATSDYYRKAFTANNLPNVYSALHYFHKSEKSKEFYKWLEFITNNWELFYGKYVSEHYPGRPSMDVTAAIAAKIMSENSSEFTSNISKLPTFVHMKPQLQSWRTPVDSWMQSVGSYFDNNCNLKIGNFQQSEIFHYVEKDFLKDTILEKLEKKLEL
jgi:hypothetical protein